MAVENTGTTFDEDIEVELLFDNDVLMEISETSHILNKSQCKYVLDEFYVDELIAIPASSQYKEYNDSKSTSAPSFTPPLMDISSGKDYDEDYVEALKDAYIYKIYPGEKKTLKIGFDYIKQHTAVAFPTVIFVKKTPCEIPYKITSKQSADVISGVISVAKL